MAKILKFSENSLHLAVNLLRNGGVISFPTETVYALACSASDQSAIDRILQIKRRVASQVFAVLVQDHKMMFEIGASNKRICKLIEQFSNGPLTCVLKHKSANLYRLSSSLIKDSKIGIRIPNHEIAQAILKSFGKPIVATSVNLSGAPSACSVAEINDELKDQIDLIIDGGPCKFGIASTVVDFTTKEPKVLRGTLSKTKLD